MSGLENIVSGELVERVGWMLVHFVWQGCAAAAALAVVLLCLRKRSANLRYVVSCAALAAMAAMPSVTIWRMERPERSQAVSAAAPVEKAATTEAVQPVISYAPIEQNIVPGGGGAVQGAGAIAPAGAKAGLKARFISRVEGLLPYLVVGWIAGVAGLSLWYLGGWTQLQRMRRRMVRPVGEQLRERLGRIAERVGVTRAVELMESALVSVPVVIGWLKPVILLPASAVTGLDAEQLEALLAHELAHIKRCDYLVNILQTMVEILGFYHPAVWWVSRRIRIEREMCCDDVAVAVCGDSVRYAKALASIAESHGLGQNLAVAASGGSLLERVRRLVLKESAHKEKANWGAVVVAVLLVTAILVTGGFALSGRLKDKKEPIAKAQPEEGEKFAVTLPNGTRVELVGLLGLGDKGIETWKPDGTPTEVQILDKDVLEADIDGYYPVLAVRTSGNLENFGPRIPDAGQLERLSLKQADGFADVHFYSLPAEAKTRRYITTVMNFKCGPIREILRLPITKQELESGLGETKFLDSHGIKIEYRSNSYLPTSSTRGTRPVWFQGSFGVWISRAEGGLPSQFPAAVDNAGRYHVFANGFDLDPNDLAGFAYIDRDKAEIRFRNISLVPGQKSEVVVESEFFPVEGVEEKWKEAVLEFRILATSEMIEADGVRAGLTRQEIEKYTKDLLANGAGAGRERGNEYIWLPIAKDTGQGPEVVEEYAGKAYALAGNRAGKMMVADGSWGLREVRVTTDNNGRPAVRLRFDSRGGELFGELTSKNVRRPLAVIIDDTIVSAPTLASALRESAMIVGTFSKSEVEEMARSLERGMPAVEGKEGGERQATEGVENNDEENVGGYGGGSLEGVEEDGGESLGGSVLESGGGLELIIDEAGVENSISGMVRTSVRNTGDKAAGVIMAPQLFDVEFEGDRYVHMGWQEVSAKSTGIRPGESKEGPILYLKDYIRVEDRMEGHAAERPLSILGTGKYEIRVIYVGAGRGSKLTSEKRVLEIPEYQRDRNHLAWYEYLATAEFLHTGGKRDIAARQFGSIAQRYPTFDRAETCRELSILLNEMAVEDRKHVRPGDVESLSVEERVEHLIYRLRDVAEQEGIVPGKCRVLRNPRTHNSAAVALREMGEAAVPAMIALLRDRRPTRSVGEAQNMARVLRYCDVALEIIEDIAGKKFDTRTERGTFLSTAEADLRERIIADVEEWWKERGANSSQKWPNK